MINCPGTKSAESSSVGVAVGCTVGVADGAVAVGACVVVGSGVVVGAVPVGVVDASAVDEGEGAAVEVSVGAGVACAKSGRTPGTAMVARVTMTKSSRWNEGRLIRIQLLQIGIPAARSTRGKVNEAQ